jgi:hypothetical protein
MSANQPFKIPAARREYSKPRGRLHRAKIRAMIVPKLYVGARVPGRSFLAKFLGVSPPSARRHIRRVLEEDGFETEIRFDHRLNSYRVFVTALPDKYLPLGSKTG